MDSDEERKRYVAATTAAIMSRISVPMDTRGFGGDFSGVLLGTKVLKKIEDAARAALADDVSEDGLPETALPG